MRRRLTQLAGPPAWVLVAVLLAGSPGVGAQPLRLFGGSFETNWNVIAGPRGHARDCRTRGCDDSDLSRANLDRSIGYRAGAERPLFQTGRLELFAGAELNVLFTEYNSSQRDVRIAEILGLAGARLDFGPFALLGRVAGGGGAFDDGRVDLAHFFEAAADVPMGKAGLRFAARIANHTGPTSTDYSVVLVDSGGPPRGNGSWRLGWSIGMSDPGRGAGESLALSAAPFSRLSAHRAIGRRGHRAGLAVQTTAHESEAKTVYFGVSGNERGKSVHSAALTWHREPHAGGPRRWRYGLGLEFANWDDDHSLLNDPSGKPVEGGFETGLLAHIGGTADIAPGARLVLGAEKAYWNRIGLGEVRFILGVEISP